MHTHMSNTTCKYMHAHIHAYSPTYIVKTYIHTLHAHTAMRRQTFLQLHPPTYIYSHKLHMHTHYIHIYMHAFIYEESKNPPRWATYLYVHSLGYVYVLRESWRIFGDAFVTIAQWRRARNLTNLGYPQVPGSIPAENPSTQINLDLSQ